MIETSLAIVVGFLVMRRFEDINDGFFAGLMCGLATYFIVYYLSTL